MGNQVIFITREDNLEQVSQSDFNDLSIAIHKGLVPSFTDTESSSCDSVIENRYESCSIKGVAFSGYHHESSGTVAHVRHDMISEPSVLMGLSRNDIEKSDFTEFAKKARSDSRFMLGNRNKEKYSFRKIKKPEEINSKGESQDHRYHIFGFLTDDLTSIENNPHVMRGVVDFIRGERNEPPNKIEHIGSYNPDQSVLVNIQGNCFDVSQPFTARGDGLKEDISQFLESRHGAEAINNSRSEAYRERRGLLFEDISLWSAKTAMNDLGYSITPQPKPENKMEL